MRGKVVISRNAVCRPKVENIVKVMSPIYVIGNSHFPGAVAG